jgi:hypothetical protein
MYASGRVLPVFMAAEQLADPGTDDTGTGGRRAPLRPVTPGKSLIQVVVPFSMLIGADDQPAELVGHGPITAQMARETAADSVWHRLLTDPESGTLLDYGRTTYRPPAAELDHIVAWADGGSTTS